MGALCFSRGEQRFKQGAPTRLRVDDIGGSFCGGRG
jgi:hypothetical protein